MKKQINHGYLEQPEQPNDYVAGASGIEYFVRNVNGNWHSSLPDNERQYSDNIDTMSCVTFSALNSIEIQLNYMLDHGLLTTNTRIFLTDNGYIVNGKFNFSDRFTAIMSDTRPTGNYLTKVAQAIRDFGLIPESMLPFGYPYSWEEYHDKNVITQEMKDLGKECLIYLTIQYEWVLTPSMSIGKTIDEIGEIRLHHLKQAPLQIAADGHATDYYFGINKDKFGQYDTYEPFTKEKNWNYNTPYVMKILVTEKSEFTEAEIIEAQRFALELVYTKPSRIGFRYEANGEAYRIEEDGTLKYKRGVPCPLFTSLCEDGTIWGINEETWDRLKPALIK
jgi:hypothetical protein